MPVSGRLNIEPEFMTFGTYDDGQHGRSRN